MSGRSIVTGAFLALVPAVALAFVAGGLVGGGPTILTPTDPSIGTGSGVTYGSTGSHQFWQAFSLTFAVVEVGCTVLLSQWLHRTHH